MRGVGDARAAQRLSLAATAAGQQIPQPAQQPAAAARQDAAGRQAPERAEEAEAADGAADDLLRERHALGGGALAGAGALAAELGQRGEQAFVLGEVLQRQAARGVGGGELRLGGAGQDARQLARQVGALQLVAEGGLAEARQAARRGVAGAEQGVGGGELVVDVGVVLAGDDRGFALREARCQRLAVAGREDPARRRRTGR